MDPVVIKLSGPGKNALGTQLMQEVRDALAAANSRPALLTGNGDAFSAGLDLKEVLRLDAQGMKAFLELLEALTVELFEYAGPLVALVNGHAIAGGCVLALCCDYRIARADERVRIGLNEVALGVRFPPTILKLARERLPRHQLDSVLLGAELYSPARARDVGFIDEVSDRAEEAAIERLNALTKHPADAYRATKLALRRGLLAVGRPEREAFDSDDLPAWTAPALKERLEKMLRR